MAQDLTGVWQGLYSYGGLQHQVGFTATLIDTGGALYGTTHESDPRLAPTGMEASLCGRRASLRVSFVKTYAAGGEAFPPITYEGTLSGDGQEVEGRWAIAGPSALSGRFLMTRPNRRSDARRRRRTVDVPLA